LSEEFLEPVRITCKCPCCGSRTLLVRGGFEVCPVCFWEDDGQDDDDADQVRDGPNGDLSLTAARANYRKFGAAAEHLLAHVRAPRAYELGALSPAEVLSVRADYFLQLQAIDSLTYDEVRELRYVARSTADSIFSEEERQIVQAMFKNFEKTDRPDIENLPDPVDPDSEETGVGQWWRSREKMSFREFQALVRSEFLPQLMKGSL
jgi:hypothetical protein